MAGLVALGLLEHQSSYEPLWTSQSVAQYPLRVDASFHEVGGTLTDVKIVRIRPQ